eukprot:2018947-Prymnesium_polylepis.1
MGSGRGLCVRCWRAGGRSELACRMCDADDAPPLPLPTPPRLRRGVTLLARASRDCCAVSDEDVRFHE